MGKTFGQLSYLRSIVTYKISPFEVKVFHGLISKGVPNTIRRIVAQIPYMGPPIVIAYIIYSEVEKEHQRLMRKNPADFVNDK